MTKKSKYNKKRDKFFGLRKNWEQLEEFLMKKKRPPTGSSRSLTYAVLTGLGREDSARGSGPLNRSLMCWGAAGVVGRWVPTEKARSPRHDHANYHTLRSGEQRNPECCVCPLPLCPVTQRRQKHCVIGHKGKGQNSVRDSIGLGENPFALFQRCRVAVGSFLQGS